MRDIKEEARKGQSLIDDERRITLEELTQFMRMNEENPLEGPINTLNAAFYMGVAACNEQEIEKARKEKEEPEIIRDIERVYGDWVAHSDIVVRMGTVTRKRRVYRDYQKNELYILFRSRRYYQSDFEI